LNRLVEPSLVLGFVLSLTLNIEQVGRAYSSARLCAESDTKHRTGW